MPKNRPTRRQADRRAQTRDELLNAATRVFARRGYHAATLDEIASDAGFTKGALYYNFESKEELFLALLDQHIDSRIALLRELQAQPASAGAKLAAGAERTVSSLRQEREWSLLYLEFSAYAARNARFRRKFEQRLQAVHEATMETVNARTMTPNDTRDGISGIEGEMTLCPACRKSFTPMKARMNGPIITSFDLPAMSALHCSGSRPCALSHGLLSVV